jgi:putative phosphoribosyl transferase
MAARFADRTSAGAELGQLVAERGVAPDTVVLGLPRGGVPVAAGVAQAIGAPLDMLVVAKLRVPSQPELAFGAVASGGVRWLNDDVVSAARLPPDLVDRLTAAELEAVAERERRLRPGRVQIPVAGRSVVLVDDGMATGATMRAAVEAARLLGAAGIIVASPLATPAVVASFDRVADRADVLEIRAAFGAVSVLYGRFPQVGEDEVARLLTAAPAG